MAKAITDTIWAINPESLNYLNRDEIQNESEIKEYIGVIYINSHITCKDENGCSLKILSETYNEFLNNKSIKSIVFDIESPGGMIGGVYEFAREIYQNRKLKPTYAIANSYAYSAACWIGCAASKFYATQSAQVGSIGVVAVHTEYSELYKNSGIKNTIIKTPEHKYELNPLESANEDALKHLQSDVNYYYEMFVKEIAMFRNKSVDYVKQNFGNGRILNADAAKNVGMIDGIISYNGLLNRLKLEIELRGLK